jgi:hypothetical protein
MRLALVSSAAAGRTARAILGVSRAAGRLQVEQVR